MTSGPWGEKATRRFEEDGAAASGEKSWTSFGGEKSFFFGEVGSGTKMKLVVNMVMGTMMCAFGEGITLCSKQGLEPSQLLEVLEPGAIANPMFKLKGPKMVCTLQLEPLRSPRRLLILGPSRCPRLLILGWSRCARSSRANTHPPSL